MQYIIKYWPSRRL